MAITFGVATTAGTNTADGRGGDGTFTATLPSGWSSGELGIIVCYLDQGTASINESWSTCPGAPWGPNTPKLYVFYKFLGSSETDPTITISGSSGTLQSLAACATFAGVDTKIPIEVTGTATSSTGTPNTATSTGTATPGACRKDRIIYRTPRGLSTINPSPRWRPDGREIAFSSPQEFASSPFNSDIFAIQLDGTGLRRITNAPKLEDLAKLPQGSVTVTVENLIRDESIFFVYVEGATNLKQVAVAPGASATVTVDQVADLGEVLRAEQRRFLGEELRVVGPRSVERRGGQHHELAHAIQGHVVEQLLEADHVPLVVNLVALAKVVHHAQVHDGADAAGPEDVARLPAPHVELVVDDVGYYESNGVDFGSMYDNTTKTLTIKGPYNFENYGRGIGLPRYHGAPLLEFNVTPIVAKATSVPTETPAANVPASVEPVAASGALLSIAAVTMLMLLVVMTLGASVRREESS